MKVAAAEAIFSVVGDDLAADYIVPSPLDPRVGRRWLPPSRRPPRTDRNSLPPLLIRRLAAACWIGLATLWAAGCGGQPPGPALCGRGDERFRDHVAGAVLCRGLAVLRHAARVDVVQDPLTALDSGAVDVVPVSPDGCCKLSRPARRRVRTSRSTRRWWVCCRKALLLETIRRRPRISRSSSSPMRRLRRGEVEIWPRRPGTVPG